MAAILDRFFSAILLKNLIYCNKTSKKVLLRVEPIKFWFGLVYIGFLAVIETKELGWDLSSGGPWANSGPLVTSIWSTDEFHDFISVRVEEKITILITYSNLLKRVPF